MRFFRAGLIVILALAFAGKGFACPAFAAMDPQSSAPLSQLLQSPCHAAMPLTLLPGETESGVVTAVGKTSLCKSAKCCVCLQLLPSLLPLPDFSGLAYEGMRSVHKASIGPEGLERPPRS